MTVSTVVNHEQYEGNGTTTVFPFRFRILKSSHMVVTVSDAEGVLKTLTLGTDYNITGVGLVTGGSVVLQSALPDGWMISLDRELPAIQETDLRNQGRFFAETHEDAFDYLTMLIQRSLSLFGLALRKPSWIAKYYDALGNRISNLADPVSSEDAVNKGYVDNIAANNLNHTLRVPENFIQQVPPLAQRANRILGFNQEGNPIAVVPGTGDASQVMLDLASSAVGKGDALIAVKQPFTGAVPRTQHSKNADALSILDFTGDDPDVLSGVTDVTAAFTTAMQVGRTVTIPSGVIILVSPSTQILGNLIIDGTLLINNTCTIACDIQVRSGSVNVNSGFTATFNGTFTAPVRKIFNGSGTVIGIKEVWPEWWGAKYDTNLQVGYSDQIMAAYNCVVATQSFRRGVIHMNAYTVDKRVTFKLKTTASIYFIGGGNNLVGGRLKVINTFSDSVVIHFTGATSSLDAIASFGIGDLSIENTSGSGALVACRFGSDSGFISGLAKNKIVNLTTHGFSYGIDIINTRLLSFDGCSTWANSAINANGVRIFTDGDTADAFVGDCDFTSCQFEPSGIGQCMQINVSIKGHQCKGIMVDKTAFYKSSNGTQLGISASNGAAVGDIFFSNSVQFDGFSNKFMEVIADGAGSIIDDILFQGTYFRGSQADSGFTFTASNGAILSCARLIGCWIANGLSTVVAAINCTGLIISRCNFYDTTGSSSNVISMNNCKSFSIDGNIASRSGSNFFARLVVISGGSDYYHVKNNNASGIPSTAVVTDSGSGTHKVISDNI